MAERSDEIVEHIERERFDLGRNIDELQNRISSAVDWRTQFDRHPMLLVGLAMGGGVLLGAMVGGSRRSSRSDRTYSSGVSQRSYASGSSALGAGSFAGASYGASTYGSESTYGSATGYGAGSSGSSEYRPDMGSSSYSSGTSASGMGSPPSGGSSYGASPGASQAGYSSGQASYGSGQSSYGSDASGYTGRSRSSYRSPESWRGSGRPTQTESSGALRGLFSASTPATRYQRSKAIETFDNIKGALIGYAAARARDYLNELLPGFSQHYDETARRNQGGPESRHDQSSGQPFTGSSAERGSTYARSGNERTESALGRDRSQEFAGEYGSGGSQSGPSRQPGGTPTSGTETSYPGGRQSGTGQTGSQAGTQTGSTSAQRAEPTPAL
ncbi:MAG TPA: hypothetical protein VFL57_10695 [Bryobacteraceae bacterium]|nr:hypothetical protein [Bryobacteraceae bacterium]